jgi:hypothetical protein
LAVSADRGISTLVVNVYARHSGKCPQSKLRHVGQHRRCKCPLWLRWGKSHRRSAKTRSWEIANKAARKLEEEFDRKASGIETPKPPDHVTIDTALELYLLDRSQREIKDSTKVQRLLGRLRNYAYSRNAVLLKDVSARMLTEWRATWTFRKDSSGPSVAWSIVKTFFRWAHCPNSLAEPANANRRRGLLRSGLKMDLAWRCLWGPCFT